MNVLFLVRHAKSSRDDPVLPDRDRPLKERGMRDASRVGEQMAKRGAKPDLILSSPARRALATAEIVAGKLDYRRKDIAVEDRLYAATADDLLAVVHELDDKTKRVMLFGHNPELTELVHRLSGKITEMATCTVVLRRYSIRLIQVQANTRDVGRPAPIGRAPRGARRSDGGRPTS
jgi:phosphohistidine phosphatase